jgi:hypothetical protein
MKRGAGGGKGFQGGGRGGRRGFQKGRRGKREKGKREKGKGNILLVMNSRDFFGSFLETRPKECNPFSLFVLRSPL